MMVDFAQSGGVGRELAHSGSRFMPGHPRINSVAAARTGS